jgi:hypothetical protein
MSVRAAHLRDFGALDARVVRSSVRTVRSWGAANPHPAVERAIRGWLMPPGDLVAGLIPRRIERIF